MQLLIDIGNTRIKWGLGVLATEVVAGKPFLFAPEQPERCFQQAWGDLERPERVVVSNVAGSEVASALSRWIADCWQRKVRWAEVTAQAAGVVNGYHDPSRLGVDRWLALLALRHNYLLPACVVDCGSAVTLDWLDADGVHQGGLIIPGLTLMERALLEGTCEIRQQSGSVDGVLGRSTAAAIHRGSLLAAAGMVEMALDQMTDDNGPLSTLVLTGGDAVNVAVQLSRPLQLVPDLVLKGLTEIE